MEKQAAQNLVQETLQGSFKKECFINLVKNILNHVEEAPFTYKGNFIFDDFTDSIRLVERVGKYKGPDEKLIDILVVHLKKETSLERARTKQRNFVAKYLKGSRGGVLKDAALVAFVAPNKEDWRFSLVKMEYKFNEKGKVEEEFTPARRYSFLVGKNENSHTAQSRLLPALLNDEVNPSLKDLEDIFSVEKVTKEFFEKYRDLYLRLKESLDDIVNKNPKVKADFKEKNVDTVDFAKKLLGQIVFLYFLQKKGWFGVKSGEVWGSGSKHFLRELFKKKHGDYKNFFNDILEPLFYEALRIKRSGDYYSRFNCRIPFLNGGLFDPINDYDWQKTEILLPNDIFSNDRKTKDGDRGDGILDIFDRYNFTVKEDEPLEKEVAIDPEMLGKVFENLLEVKDRKSKGTYYTPREIVHYMCQESLANYLATELEGKVSKKDIETLIKYGESVVEHDSRVANEGRETDRYSFKLSQSVRKYAKLIDEKLTSIRVCDPAVGSGAFPVGMMNEIIRTRNALTPYIGKDGERTPYHFKLHAIQNCLYGVDIDQGAVEIAKLRLWLSLVVDEEERETIQPLPNLDYKIMQGNSLVELLNPESLFSSTDNKRTALVTKLKALKNELFEITLPSAKKKKRDEINNLIRQLFEHDRNKQIEKFENKILAIKSQKRLFEEEIDRKDDERKIQEIRGKIQEIKNIKISGPTKHFEWHINFSEIFHEKGGFDVVIANPPYIGEKGHKEIFQEIKEKSWLSKFYQGKMDIFYFFFHLALNLSHQGSNIAFITTNYYITATGASKLRKDFKERSVVKRLVNFNELKLFKSALGQHNLITILQRGNEPDALARTAISQRKGIATQEILRNILDWTDDQTAYHQVKQKKLYEGVENYMRLAGSSGISKILDRIKLQGIALASLYEINQGIVTGADKVSKSHIDKYGLKANVGDGIFVLSDREIAKINFATKEKQILQPWFKNSDITRYYTHNRTNQWVLYLNGVYKESDIPNVIRHLSKFKANLQERREVHKGARNWYDLWWSREKPIFISPKIVAPQRSQRNTFGYNEIPWYASADVYFITGKDKGVSLKYILALLNSRLYYLWLYHRGKRKGETLELYQKPLSEIPIKKISKDEQKPFIDLVDKILAITKDSDYLENPAKQAKVREYEKQIDQLVYKLYNLTPEEIKIVEGSAK